VYKYFCRVISFFVVSENNDMPGILRDFMIILTLIHNIYEIIAAVQHRALLFFGALLSFMQLFFWFLLIRSLQIFFCVVRINIVAVLGVFARK